MALCDCGNVTGHILLKTTQDGKRLPDPLRWVCPSCSPLDFPAERFGSVTDKKLWLVADTDPNQYEMVGGVKRMKDWAQAEFEQRIGREDADEVQAREQARERKRQQAREVRTLYGTTLKPELERQLESQLREMRIRESCESMGLVLPA
jgi:hypothetical protein